MTMEQRVLGHSGMPVSALSLGSWMTWETMDERDARAVLEAGLAAGITFLDDARYNDRTGKAPLRTGYSEVLFGRLLRDIGVDRQRLVVANKLWFEFYPQESVEAELDGSLSRLQMDYLDIVYCEQLPAKVPRAATIAELDRLIGTGKLRAWGVLNWTAAEIAEAVRVARANGHRPPAGAQLAYSVLTRDSIEAPDMVQACADGGVGIVASFSLYGGLLTGKYRGGAADGRLAGALDDERTKALLPRVEPFLAIAREVGCTPSQLALAYCLKNPQVSSVVFGARSLAQLEDNLGALRVAENLTDETLDALRRL
jgi:aryl-alcohol dehydrogenase-like predicted oxidoreductase